MKSLFWLVLVFAAAAALAVFGRTNEGYALPRLSAVADRGFAAARHRRAAAHVRAALLGDARDPQGARTAAQVRAYRERRSRERAQGALAAALQAYLEGRFVRAEREAQRAWDGDSARGLAALIGARAAHQLRQAERRDQWFQRAESVGSESLKAARLISRAELALEDRDFAAAREALSALHESGPRHIATLRMLIRAERGAATGRRCCAWRPCSPSAMRSPRESPRNTACRRSWSCSRAMRPTCARWKSAGARCRARPGAAARRGRRGAHFSALGKAAPAREALERALDADWAPQLVSLYGELPAAMAEAERGAEARTRIERGERWLLERSKDAQLLATLGRLCAQVELWGKARNFPRGEPVVRSQPLCAPRARAARRAARAGRGSAAALPPRRRDFPRLRSGPVARPEVVRIERFFGRAGFGFQS
jgi:HemY protein